MRLAPRLRLLSPALLALLLVGAAALAAAGGAAAQSDRHRSYADAPTDEGIFYAILANASTQAGHLAEAAQGSIGPDGGPEANTTAQVDEAAAELDSLAGGFTDELRDLIASEATAPPRLAALHEAVIAVNRAGQGLASADVDRQHAIGEAAIETEAPPDEDEEEALVEAVEALEAERAALLQLRDAAAGLEDEGVDASPLEAALAELDADLLAQRDLLERELVRLDVPALLTLSVETPSVEFGGQVSASGLALSGGNPAGGDEVTVRFAGEKRTATVSEDGRYRASIPVPDDVAAGTHAVEASAEINDTAVSAGPALVTVEPMTPHLSLDPATTVMAERANLTLEGRLEVGSLAEAGGEAVAVTYNGEPVARTATDADGDYQARVDVTPHPGGHVTLRAHWTSDDPRLTDASSPGVSVFVPFTEEQRRARAAQADPVYAEFDFPRTGLGPVTDILAGITLVGLVVLVANAALTRGGTSLSVEGITRRIRFQKIATFHIATEEDKYHADPRNAYPPLDADQRDVGELYEAFLDGVREFEAVPPSLTHRGLAAYLRDEGVPEEAAAALAWRYEAARYRPDGPADDEQVRAAFERAWDGYVETREIEGTPWPTVTS